MVTTGKIVITFYFNVNLSVLGILCISGFAWLMVMKYRPRLYKVGSILHATNMILYSTIFGLQLNEQAEQAALNAVSPTL